MERLWGLPDLVAAAHASWLPTGCRRRGALPRSSAPACLVVRLPGVVPFPAAAHGSTAFRLAANGCVVTPPLAASLALLQTQALAKAKAAAQVRRWVEALLA